MIKHFKTFISVIFIICLLSFTFSCKTTPDAKKSKNDLKSVKIAEDKDVGMVRGKLTTVDGLKFSYRFYSSDTKGASVIYIPGTGGFMTYSGAGSGSYSLGKPLKKNGFNFFTFSRADLSLRARGWDAHYKNLTKRTKSRYTYFLTKDGKESAAQNIVRNEVKTAIDYVEKSPTHDPEKGIYLIGSSYGSWLVMVTVKSFPSKIKGVVFLSPAILREWMTSDQEKYPQLDIIEYWASLIQAFGKDRPALAIGGSKEKIDGLSSRPYWPAIKGAKFLRDEIGPSVEILDTSPSVLHGVELVGNKKDVRAKIVNWITNVNSR